MPIDTGKLQKLIEQRDALQKEIDREGAKQAFYRDHTDQLVALVELPFTLSEVNISSAGVRVHFLGHWLSGNRGIPQALRRFSFYFDGVSMKDGDGLQIHLEGFWLDVLKIARELNLQLLYRRSENWDGWFTQAYKMIDGGITELNDVGEEYRFDND